jgi:hypothetical protein
MSEQAHVVEHGWETTSMVLDGGRDTPPLSFGASSEPNGDPPTLMLWGSETDETDGWK